MCVPILIAVVVSQDVLLSMTVGDGMCYRDGYAGLHVLLLVLSFANVSYRRSTHTLASLV